MSKIAVVGDSMVDEDYKIEANRISPEFPIPVLLSSEDKPVVQLPGGAANVAFQLINMGAETTLGSVLDTGAIIVFDKHGIKQKHLCYTCKKGHQIPRKKRFYNGEFPLCRWDVEKKIDNSDAAKEIFESLKMHIRPEVVILSDYDKGFFPNRAAKKLWLGKDWTTIVDPKKGPLEDWEGCDIIKPNFQEATELTGTSDWIKQLDIIRAKTNCRFAIITHGARFYFHDGKQSKSVIKRHPSSIAKYPVGAGDCFVAALAIAIGEGKPFDEAIDFAFNCGEAYVNTPKRYVNKADLSRTKSLFPKDIANDVAKNPNMKFVFTNGCFDILHAEHIKMLKYAKSQGDALIVAINGDESVQRLKGENRPVQSLRERMEIMEAIECVDYVTYFHEDTPLEMIKEIKPWAIVKGGDYKEEDVVGHDLVEKVIIYPYKEGTSTSNIIKKATSL